MHFGRSLLAQVAFHLAQARTKTAAKGDWVGVLVSVKIGCGVVQREARLQSVVRGSGAAKLFAAAQRSQATEGPPTAVCALP